MNSSTFARSAGSSFDNPAASYSSGDIAFCTPGNGVDSGSAAESGRSEAGKRQANETIFFIDQCDLRDSLPGGLSKQSRELLQVVDFDQPYPDATALAGEN